jgi:hypothetical protein
MWIIQKNAGDWSLFGISSQMDHSKVFLISTKSSHFEDIIHNSKPTQPYKEKYDSLKGDPLPEKKLKLFSKQILEALIYLTAHRWPVYSLHTGNCFVVNGACKISEFENDLLGVPSKLAFIWKALLEKNLPLTSAATYVFGAVFYEMVVGYELDNVRLDDLPSNIHPGAKKVLSYYLWTNHQLLRKIFDGKVEAEVSGESSSYKNELNTGLIALRDDPFFKGVQLFSEWEAEPVRFPFDLFDHNFCRFLWISA